MACSSVLLLFFLGGLVRVTGSGMGCPDWPKCFGLIAPPTCSCQLPANYQEIFLKKRLNKVEKFAATLEKFGFAQKAAQIRNDKSILVPEEFNAFKAWTEYINRIFGVISGLLTLLFFIFSLTGRFGSKVWIFSGLGLLMLVLNAWLGSIVVATNLLPGIVTLHFMLSFLCVFCIMLAMHAAKPFAKVDLPSGTRRAWSVIFALVITEVILGALARENVELLWQSGKLVASDGMMDYKAMQASFTVHRLLPGLLFALSAGLSLFYYKKLGRWHRPFVLFALLCLIQISLGALNIVLVIPPAAQVSHILLGALLPVVAFYYILARDTAKN